MVATRSIILLVSLTDLSSMMNREKTFRPAEPLDQLRLVEIGRRGARFTDPFDMQFDPSFPLP